MHILRDLALLASSIGHEIEQFRRVNGVGAATRATEHADNGSGIAEVSARQLGDDFLLSIAVSFNQAVLSNIDAIDSALIGVLGATVAFAVLTVDKIRELPAVPRWIAITLLAFSGLVSLIGYADGFVGRSTRDGPRPALFVPDFTLYGLKAVARAIRETVRRSEENLNIRRRKRIVALLAIGLLIAGAVVVTYARLGEPVVSML